jgi:hypothetical protein
MQADPRSVPLGSREVLRLRPAYSAVATIRSGFMGKGRGLWGAAWIAHRPATGRLTFTRHRKSRGLWGAQGGLRKVGVYGADATLTVGIAHPIAPERRLESVFVRQDMV